MKSILLKTSIPGPRSLELARRRDSAVARAVYQSTSVFVERSQGAVIEDVDGNRFIDLAGGIGCLNAGHRPQAVVDAVQRQAERYLHTCFMVTPYEPYVRLAEKLNEIAPGPGLKKTALFNSGAEAVENAVKIARAYTRRAAILCFEDAFHGRTMMALSLTSKTHPYKIGFEPFANEVYRIPLPSCYRNNGTGFANILEDTFARSVAAESLAAVIIEPVLGEGGFFVPPAEFFTVLQQICRQFGILIITDEIQTGFARTGHMFASEHFGFEPDLLLTAKTLGGGLPLAAVTGKAEIMDHTAPGSLGGTFGGNPVACEAALTTIEIIERERLCHRACSLGDRFRKRALGWKDQYSFIVEVRGLGAMQAIEFSRTSEHEGRAQALTTFCLENGVIVLTAGTYSNVVRLLMPLVITDAEFDEAMEVMERGLAALETEHALTVSGRSSFS